MLCMEHLESRNKSRFQSAHTRSESVYHNATEEALAFWETRGLISTDFLKVKRVQVQIFSWVSPETDTIKSNFDGGVIHEDSKAACGFIMRSCTGTIVAAGSVATLTCNVVKAELQGLWEGVMVAVRDDSSFKL